MKKYKLIILIALISLIVIAFSLGFYYKYQISAVSRESEKVIVEIKSGSVYSIGDTLYENNLIKSKFIFKIYVKLNGVKNLQASTYEFDKNMSLKEIIEVLESGNGYNPDEIRITFKEGLSIRQVAKVIEENTNNSYDDVMKLMEDKDYINSLIDTYWFLTEDITNSKIYYPLEGYLFPNTYAFMNKDVDIKTIIEKLLKETDKQLSEYKESINKSKMTIHEIITLASVVEKEGKVKDFKNIASVFVNRLGKDQALQSCATLYYGMRMDFDMVGIATDKMTMNNNPYNTYMYSGLPVGPISSPSLAAIEATLEPRDTDYYYFLSDNEGVSYFFKTYIEHTNKKQQLINQGKWYR